MYDWDKSGFTKDEIGDLLESKKDDLDRLKDEK